MINNIFSVSSFSKRTCNTHVMLIENEGVLNPSDVREHCKVCKSEGYDFVLLQGNKLPVNEETLQNLGFEPKTSKYSPQKSWYKRL